MRRLHAIVALIAISVSGAVPALGQSRQRAPEPWFVTVSHKVDLTTYKSANEAQVLGNQYVINITAGLVVDPEGHVVTRLVNYDPTGRPPKVSVTTVTGKILAAELVGVDGPSGLAVLSVPLLRGARPVPAEAAPDVSEGDLVRILFPDYRIRQIRPPIENIAITPQLGTLDGRVAIASPHPALGLAGVRFVVDAPSFTQSQDLSLAEDATGRLVGLVKYVAVGKAQIVGLPFIRDVVARRVLDQRGNVAAAWLGADGTTAQRGVRVNAIASGGPAAAAGLQRDDVIVGFGDVPIENGIDLKNAIDATPAGTKVTISVLREGKPVSVSPELGTQPAAGKPFITQQDERRQAQLAQIYIGSLKQQAAKAKNPEERAKVLAELERFTGVPAAPPEALRGGAEVDIASIGLSVINLSGQMAAKYGLSGGVLVYLVKEDSLAAKAGLVATDIITAVDDAPVADETMLRSALRSAASNGAAAVRLTIRRDAQSLTLPLSVESLR
jgi:serine protease DegS